MHISSWVKIHWDLLKSLSWTENMDVSRADNFVKTDKICPLAIPNQNSNEHIRFNENPLIFTQVIIWKRKFCHVTGKWLSKIDEICPSAIPNQISIISMHTLSLVKSIDIYLSYQPEVSWADNSVKNGRNLPISNSKPDLHSINAHTKFCENSLTFTHLERKIQTDRQT